MNRPLEQQFQLYYSNHFAMGGLAGFPFSGVTGFKAMSSHVPDNGSSLIVYGPHVGIDNDGVLGRIDRRGMHDHSTCCGSAVAGYDYLRIVTGKRLQIPRTMSQTTVAVDLFDFEQQYVNNILMSFADRLTKASDPMLELPYCCFEAQDELMRRIMNQACSERPYSGQYISLLGGIQINTPAGFADCFCPLRFEILDKSGSRIDNFITRSFVTKRAQA
jgi:hypothetical protein